MTPDDKLDHIRDLLRRQRYVLSKALDSARMHAGVGSQLHHWIDEADRFADLADRAAYTARNATSEVPRT